MARAAHLVLTVVFVVCVMAWPLLAQEPVNEFRPVAPGELEQEQIPAARLVFAAYGFVWACFVGYLFIVWQKLRRLDVELGEVRAKLGGSRR